MNLLQLDNPAWYSLSQTHQPFVIDYNGMKCYHPEYCPFGGFMHIAATDAGLNAYTLLTGNFFIVGDRPDFSNHVQLKNELVCHQMILERPMDILITEEITELKTVQHKAALAELVNLVQPGYFKARTSELGNYYGIYKEGKLIAVTGERMKMDGFTEVSAVVTHPEHSGKGYAKQLVAYAGNKIFDEEKIPYLHVAESNSAAIGLYEKLGFKTRRKISFWNFIANHTKE